MKSMTGYGASQFKSADTEISVVIKSVNGRFLETRFHLPKEYFQFESQLKKKVSQKIRRGTVDVFIHRQGPTGMNIKLNKDSAQKWLKAHQELAKSINLKVDQNFLLERLATLPNIFSVQDRQSFKAGEKQAFLKAFQSALLKCDAERVREGSSLNKHLKQILSEMIRVVDRMEELRRKMKDDFASRLNQRLQRAGLEGQVEPARFAQELVIYLDKGDIAEEIERLREHIHMCELFLKAPEEQGKKLDFYSQELLREVNTIGSKANNAELTEQVVRAKGLIESFKEQVQNIE